MQRCFFRLRPICLAPNRFRWTQRRPFPHSLWRFYLSNNLGLPGATPEPVPPVQARSNNSYSPACPSIAADSPPYSPFYTVATNSTVDDTDFVDQLETVDCNAGNDDGAVFFSLPAIPAALRCCNAIKTRRCRTQLLLVCNRSLTRRTCVPSRPQLLSPFLDLSLLALSAGGARENSVF